MLRAQTTARDAPDEVLRPTDDEDYMEYREQTDMREPYRWANGCRPLQAARRIAAAHALAGLPPAACVVESTHPALLLRAFCSIPAEYLVGTKRYVGLGVADTPLVVFINAKSGGRVGPRLLTVLFRSLGSAQVVRRRGRWCRGGCWFKAAAGCAPPLPSSSGWEVTLLLCQPHSLPPLCPPV